MKKILIAFCMILFVSLNLTAQSSITGEVYYHGDTSKPIENVNVKLIDTTGVVIDSCLTDIDGLYQFNNVSCGTYILESTTDIDPGGIDLGDAYLLSLYLLNYYTLSPIQQLAADVNGDGSLNWSDYFIIVIWNFTHGNPFPAGDWIFEPISYVVGNKQKEDPPPVSGSSRGDVDGSFQPGEKPMSDLLVNFDGLTTVGVNEEFEIPVKINTDILINSIGLVFDYPDNGFNIIDVSSDQGILNFNADNGQLRISCVNKINKSFEFLHNPIIIIKAKVNNQIIDIDNNFILNEESHIIDSKCQRLKNVTLSIPNINIFEYSSELSNNYPNPFTNNTSIDYSLSGSANVIIKLYDLMGQEVVTLVNKFQNEGEYSINFNSNDYQLKPGKYIYKMTLNGNYKFSRSKIMIIL